MNVLLLGIFLRSLSSYYNYEWKQMSQTEWEVEDYKEMQSHEKSVSSIEMSYWSSIRLMY